MYHLPYKDHYRLIKLLQHYDFGEKIRHQFGT